MSKQVMLSYSRRDEEFVRKFHADLEAKGVKTWLDLKDIAPGYSWRQALYDGVLTSDAMIMFLSEAYVNSEMCRMECFLARINNKLIIPVVIDGNIGQDALIAHFETKGVEDMSWMILQGRGAESLEYNETHIENIISLLNDDFTPVPDEPVYICYRSPQREFAEKLMNDLATAGIPVWMDVLMDFGVDWREALWTALKQAKAMVVVMDADIASSTIIHKEILIARTRNLPTFPIVPAHIPEGSEIEREMRHTLDESYEMRLLSEIQWLRPIPDYDSMIEKLVSHLHPLWEVNE